MKKKLSSTLLVVLMISIISLSQLVLPIPGHAAGLTGHWKLDGNANDSAGTNHGTVMGGATFVAGHNGSAISLDGVDDYVSMGDITPADFGTNDFTISAWIKANTTAGYMAFIAKNDAFTNVGYELRFDAGKLEIILVDNTANKVSVTAPSANVWHHVVALRRGDNLELYIDNFLTGTDTGNDNIDISSTQPFQIGARRYNGPAQNFFNGLVDDARIYDYALNQSEIAALYNGGGALVGHWKLDGNANDSAGTNHGTLMGGPVFVTGHDGSAISLDGVDDYVSMGDIPVADFGTNDFSISTWIKANTTAGYMAIIAKNDASTNVGYELRFDAGKLEIILVDNSVNKVSVAAPSANAWHHLVALRRGDNLELYVDSVLTGTDAGNDNIEISSSLSFQIGARRYNGLAQNFLNGLVDEARIYNYALSQSEITTLYGGDGSFVNIAVSGKATASTQLSWTQSVFRAIDEIVGVTSPTGEWASTETNPWIKITWNSLKKINKVELYDRADTGINANGGTLTFSDGSSLNVTGIPTNGAVKLITFANKMVDWVKFQVSGGAGSNVGLKEIKIYGEGSNLPNITPWKVINVDSGYGGSWVVTGDIDNDGQAEIISARNSGNTDNHYVTAIACQELDGTLKWHWGTSGSGVVTWSHDVPVQLYDWDNDGALEVLFISSGNFLSLNGATGAVERTLALPSSNATDSLYICNLSGNSRPNDIIIKDRYDNLWAYNYNWTQLWHIYRLGGYKICHAPLSIDINSDGKDEIICGFGMVNSNGTTRWILDDSRTATSLPNGHLDCARVVTNGGSNLANWRIALTVCGANGLLMVDGNGTLIWEKTGAHWESIDAGDIDPSLAGNELITEIDHLSFGVDQPIYVFNRDGVQLSTRGVWYNRTNTLLDWSSSPGLEIVNAYQHQVYDKNLETIANLDVPKDCRLIQCSSDFLGTAAGDLNGDGKTDILLLTESPEKIYIFTNISGSSSSYPVGCGTNFTLY